MRTDAGPRKPEMDVRPSFGRIPQRPDRIGRDKPMKENGALVLVVDDEKDLRSLLEFNLKQADLPGTEVCKRLKSDPSTQRIPVIMLTARTGEADRIAGFELGADDYVPKPFSVRELILRLEVARRRLSGKGDTLGASARF